MAKQTKRTGRSKSSGTSSKARSGGRTLRGAKPRPHLADVADMNMDHPDAPGVTNHTPGAASRIDNAGKRGAAPDTGRLNPPTEEVGPQGSDETLAPEIHDPNFPLKRSNHGGRRPPRELAWRLKPTNPHQRA